MRTIAHIYKYQNLEFSNNYFIQYRMFPLLEKDKRIKSIKW